MRSRKAPAFSSRRCRPCCGSSPPVGSCYRDVLARGAGSVGRAIGPGESVIFAGWRNDAATLLRLFDLFCLPSLQEGFSVALLEAMAQARPIVATAVAGNPEAVVNRETGWLVPPGDGGAGEDEHAAALAGGAGRIGTTRAWRLLDLFTLRMQDQYAALYHRRLMEKRGGHAL
ncbi:MAG: glycosyltransferase family 4 protein [Nitrospiraceae bacterium]